MTDLSYDPARENEADARACEESPAACPDFGPPQEPPGGWRCTICRVNRVDAGNGFDTCSECLAKQ